MNKNSCVIYAPIDHYGGYPAHARSKIKSIIENKKDEWDIKILSCSWGNLSGGFITDNEKQWGWLKEYILQDPLTSQPDYFITITIPEEFKPIGKYNIGITAGIESTACIPEWIQGCNKMNEVWVSSEHSKKVFEITQFEEKDQQGNVKGLLKLNTPISVIFEGGDLETYFPINKPTEETFDLSYIKEKFIYLVSGLWSSGDISFDRKNIGLTIKLFLETFKNKPNPPALLLKTSLANTSYMNRDQVLRRIMKIRKTVKADTLPNVYLLNGDITDEQMNNLYNHPRIKAMLSFHKGEGWGRGLFEFTLVNKPLIASGWSGSNDFLNPELTMLLPGKLENIHPSAINKWLIKEAQWFAVDINAASGAMLEIYNNYKKYKQKAITQGYKNRNKFSYNEMTKLIKTKLDLLPKYPVYNEIKLPNFLNK